MPRCRDTCMYMYSLLYIVDTASSVIDDDNVDFAFGRLKLHKGRYTRVSVNSSLMTS